MFERVHDAVGAARVAEDLQRAVGDHLVGVHVGRCACAALDLVDDELVVQRTAADLDAGRDDRLGDLGVELPELADWPLRPPVSPRPAR